MAGNILCKRCGKAYKLKSGFSEAHCSGDCAVADSRRKRACIKGCAPEDLSTRIVTFAGGQTRLQQVCSKCLQTKFIARPRERH